MSIAHALRYLGDTVVIHGSADPAADRTALGVAIIDAFGVPMHDLPNLDIDALTRLGLTYASRTGGRNV